MIGANAAAHSQHDRPIKDSAALLSLATRTPVAANFHSCLSPDADPAWEQRVDNCKVPSRPARSQTAAGRMGRRRKHEEPQMTMERKREHPSGPTMIIRS